MRKIFSVLVIFAVVTASSGCSDVEYPPRAAMTAQTGEEEDSKLPEAGSYEKKENKYKTIRQDLTVKSYNSEISDVPDWNKKAFSVEFDFNSPQHYRISIIASGDGVVSLCDGANEVYGAFYVNGLTEVDVYSLSPIFFPNKTDNNIRLEFKLLRGVVNIDRIIAEDCPLFTADRFVSDSKLNTPFPSQTAVAVYDFLKSRFGNKSLTAQFCSVNSNAEIESVYAATGRLPAVRFGETDGIFVDNSHEIELAEDWHDRGGIVGFIWNWQFPGENGGGIYSDEVDVTLKRILSGSENVLGLSLMDLQAIELLADSGEITSECARLFRDLDALYAAFAELDKKDIPVLFCPLPDGGSGLYWWSGDGGSQYIKLWEFVYERLIDYHGLGNLIWVFNGGDYDYYPGNNRVDIIAVNVFADESSKNQTGSQAVKLAQLTPDKPAMVLESNALPSPDVLFRDNAGWLMWGHGAGALMFDENGENGAITDEKRKMLDRFYNHELTFCLDDLPKF